MNDPFGSVVAPILRMRAADLFGHGFWLYYLGPCCEPWWGDFVPRFACIHRDQVRVLLDKRVEDVAMRAGFGNLHRAISGASA